MTTEEKLQHFLEFCVEDAKTRSTRMLEEYSAALEQTFSEHQADAKRRAAMQIEQETEKIKRETNKQISIQQINQKRLLNQKKEELEEKLFVELRDMLSNYMETPDYHTQLEMQVKKALEFAGDQEIIIYMDPADGDMVQRIALHHNATIRISEDSFLGGIRAVIPGRNILIDNSFQTKLDDARNKFTFDTEEQGNDKNR